jgi:hypothetical protein
MDLPIKTMTQSWLRFHPLNRDCLNWGLTPKRPFAFRFDAPNAEYGVLYVAADEYGAFIETFGHNTGIRRISRLDLESRRLSRVDVSRPLRLVDLSGTHLAQIGADNRLITSDYTIAQQWALAFFQHPQTPDGIYYPSRHDNEHMCAAIFDRTSSAITATPLGTLADLQFEDLLLKLLATYKFAFSTL